MKYAFFDNNGRIATAHNDDTVSILPVNAFELNAEQWARRFELKLVDDNLIFNQESISHVMLVQRVLVNARNQRAPALAALDILRQDALVAFATAPDQAAADIARGDAAAIQSFIQGLRDIPTIDLSAATTEAQMVTAIKTAYAALVAAAPAHLKPKFKTALGLK